MLFYYSTHADHVAVTNFARVTIEDFVECFVLWEILVYEMDELFIPMLLWTNWLKGRLNQGR